MTSTADKFKPSTPKLLEYVARSEPWCEYELEDGTVLRVRIMVTKIIDLGAFGPEGFPLYNIACQQVIDMTWPDAVQAAAERRRNERNQP